MTKKVKNLSVLTIAVLAGLFVTFSSLNIQANQIITFSNDATISLTDNVAISVIAMVVVSEDNKCGEGKCNGAEKKEAKKKTPVKTEKEGEKEAAPASKCGEGKCGEGKCGVA